MPGHYTIPVAVSGGDSFDAPGPNVTLPYQFDYLYLNSPYRGTSYDLTTHCTVGPPASINAHYSAGAGAYVVDGGPTWPATFVFDDYAMSLFASSGELAYTDTLQITFNYFISGARPFESLGVFINAGHFGAYRTDGGSASGAAAAPAALNLDAHRRPLAVLTLSGLTAAYSNDGGHTFVSASLGAGADPSLLVDARRNVYRIPFSTGSGLSQHSGSLQDGYVAAAGSPAVLAGLSGKYPCAAQHPTDRDYALLAYLDGTTLKTAWSADAGATWAYQSTVATGVDLTASGRPALGWLGETAFLASGPGPALLVRKSLDRGLTWAAPVTVATAPTNPGFTAAAYSGLSLLGWQGKLYLLGWGYRASGTTLTPSLWVSPDLGATWAASPGALPAGLAPPSALGMIPWAAQHRLGITHYSNDDTLHWLAD